MMSSGSPIQRPTVLRLVHTLSLVLLVLATLIGQGLPTASAAPVQAPVSPKVDALLAEANAKGAVRVIVGLNVKYAPEGALANPGAVASQRQGIALAQQAVLSRVTSKNVRLQARFEFIPYMAFSTDAMACARSSPIRGSPASRRTAWLRPRWKTVFR